jgi:cyclic beta-1,2-glucan synthetase
MPEPAVVVHASLALGDAPLRAEFLSAERLADLARALAAAQRWTDEGRPRSSRLITLAEKAASALASDNLALARMARSERVASPAAEWLLDNYYLIEEQVLLVREDLPTGYGLELPRLTAGPLEGMPRLYEALLLLITHTDARLDEDYLYRFVRGFQEVSGLTIGEVWAVPIMLRIGLVENVRRLSASVVASSMSERAAASWAERLVLAAQDRPEELHHLLGELERESREAPPAFFVRLAQRLGDMETGGEVVGAWLEHRLDSAGIRLDQAAAEDQHVQAADQVSIANSITSIRFLDALEWREFFERVSLVEETLRGDPAQTYAEMDFESRDRYRHALEAMAQRCPLSETQLAQEVLAVAREALVADPANSKMGHVGWWLISGGRYELEQRVHYRPHLRERLYRGPLRDHAAFYGTILAVCTAAPIALLAYYARWAGAGWPAVVLLVLLALVPGAEPAQAVTNRLAASVFPPRLLPKLDHRVPLVPSHRTLVVVPGLLGSVSAVRHIVGNLEVAYLANRDHNIGFALLGDLRAADSQVTESDARIVEAAVRGISELNERYEAEHGVRPFHLLVRSRVFNPAEGEWMGWERKRGALVDLVREMRGESETPFSTKLGDAAFRRSAAFVITLDTDTVLPRDAARKLVCTIAHPLNRAALEQGDRRVKSGYGLVQPRVGMSLIGSRRSKFASMYSGPTGIDPYANAVSDTYQDVFGEGSFTGKGIFEVDVFSAVLEGRFPENRLLSHDMIEGSFLRTALASDIEVLDDYPSNYLAATARLHRWVRGDWQTLPYLGRTILDEAGKREPNPLRPLHKWKVLDNVRRSLVAPTAMVLLTLGWLLIPGRALLYPLGMMAVLFFPAYFSLADSLLGVGRTLGLSQTVPTALHDLRRDLTRTGLSLAVLPHTAERMTDAIVRTIYRTLISKRHLLEWEIAADAEKRAGTDMTSFWRAMGPGVAAAFVLLALGTRGNPVRAAVAGVLGVVWIAGPALAKRLSQPQPLRRPAALPAGDRDAVRRIARKTWRFFETFVTAEGHHLAPDNYQEDPAGEVAWRTSPTNIGLQLLASLTAYDLGYLTVAGLDSSVSATLATMAGLERFHGHFYNWYDIRSLAPLRPAYVSTVDSGNLAGHLLVLRAGLLEASEAPILGPQLMEGMRDSARLALEDLFAAHEGGGAEAREVLDSLERTLSLAETPANLDAWCALLDRLQGYVEQLAGLVGTAPQAAAWARSANAVVAEIGQARALRDACVPWAGVLGDAPSSAFEDRALDPLTLYTPSLVGLAEGLAEVLARLDELAGGEDSGARWAESLAAQIRASRPAAVELLARLRLDAEMAREMWEHTDFRMLYDSHRQLFSIGYNLNEGRLDRSYYDLLASECRLASYLAVAKGDVPQEHWFRLGRALAATHNGRVLVSWSASMFEYLMPLLVMPGWPGTLLDETYESVVDRQIAYGRERSVPWGVSESAFNARDAQLTYQYQAFGVPGMGLKRGLSDDIVVAPYASMLALPIAPHAVVENLAAFSTLGAEGEFGFYEALDFTPGRIPAGQKRAVVKAYFAHHQGMSLVALGNALLDRRMVWRFQVDPVVSSADLLLQERVPRHVQLVAPHVEEVEYVRTALELPPPVARFYPVAETVVPSTHFLSNGRYSVMVTNGGGGYSRFEGTSVTRYREDVTRDCWGTFFYVRDTDTGEVFSAPHNPCPSTPDEYRATFAPDKAEFRRLDGTLETRVEITVSPEDDAEVRRLTLTNTGRTARHLEVTSYFEIALSSQGSDLAHKSFSNLFVETEAVPETNSVLFTRRPRSSDEPRIWGVHLVACGAEPCDWSFETNRGAFLGRLHGAAGPAAVDRGGPLGDSQGAVLDPCCAMRRTVTIDAGQTVRLAFVTGVTDSRDKALRLAEKYHDTRSAQRAIDLAWTAAQLELRDLGISPQEAVTLERLASRLLLTDPFSPLKVKTPVENGLQMSGLWSIGVSGDLPILLVRVEELEHAPLVRQALLAHQYWRHKGLVADLVILNTRPTGYGDDLDERLKLLVRTGHALQMLDRPGGVFLRRADQMHPDVLTLLLSVARATLEGSGGTIELQLNRRGRRPQPPAELHPAMAPREYPEQPFERPALRFDNGLGGFDAETGDYVIVLREGDNTPAPWIDVLANPDFGCTVSEAGVGCTWALNSHENRITTWNNDPVSDGSGEAIFIRDEDTGEFWSPTPLPVRTPEPYVVRHGLGRVRFEHTTHGISHELDWVVPPDDPIRICRLKLTNLSDQPRRLTATQFAEWVLGDSRSRAQQLVVTWFDAENDILTAHNHFNLDFPGRCAFMANDLPLHSWTASRTEFVGRNGRPSEPAAMGRAALGELSGRYHDNCGALMSAVELPAGGSAQVTFLLGQTASLEECRELVARYRQPGAADRALDESRAFWNGVLGKLEVHTPDERLDLLVNGRLLYQVLACRLWGRTATYQSSGAYGFRDQLQDVMALLMARPDLVREQIVEATRHQFPEGDVLHWWQPYSGRGVRTHMVDDRNWLPLVVAEYLDATGDTGVLDERTAFIDAPPLPLEDEDAYLQPAVAEKAATVYEHCVLALERSRGVGEHGLPLMGGGDWNDGMNRVGREGRGESVWMAWFLGYVLTRFAPVCESRGEAARAEEYRGFAAQLAAAAEESAWDGAWYRRAYFDDGTPLGTKTADECRIDAVAQSWAIISGLADPERAEQALDSVDEKLVRREDGLIALLTPPFDHSSLDPGYIKGYVPGVRENGGQYTHAALWVVLAYLISGDGDEAASLLDVINPITHSMDREGAARYKVEPYVVAADVYAVEPHVGRGGWTWYTGSASWFYRVAVSSLLGFKIVSREGTAHLAFDPCIPKRWTDYSAVYRHGSSAYRIAVENPRGVNRGVERVELDGTVLEGHEVPLVDDGADHEVRVVLLGG